MTLLAQPACAERFAAGASPALSSGARAPAAPLVTRALATPTRLAVGVDRSRPPASASWRSRRRGGFDDVGGYDGFGVESLGLETLGPYAPAYSGDDGPDGAPRPLVISAPRRPPCAPPLLIRVGRGPRHAASTRVVYGAPPCGF